MELTTEQRHELAKLAKFIVLPSLGFLATRHIYIHKGEITGYIQYQTNNKGFISGLARGKDMLVSQFSGRFLPNGEVEIESSNLEDDDIGEVRDFFKHPTIEE
jgi:hypothetical protein